MKRTEKGYLYNGYEINRVTDINVMTLCKQMWGWKVVSSGKTISPYLFDRLHDAKAFVDTITKAH